MRLVAVIVFGAMPPPKELSSHDGTRPSEPVIRTVRKEIPLLSLIVPVFNEENSVESFLLATAPVLASLAVTHEILFVDDGSTDNTLSKLAELGLKFPSLRVISFTRNFSKEAALTAGIDHAKGDIVVPLDVDLQDPPELIGRFIELWREGYDVVYGMRSSRDSDSLSKSLTALLYYRVFNYVSHTRIPENVGDFRLMDRRVIDVLRMLPERNRFMKGLFAWVGFRSIGVPYDRPARNTGTTKWNYWRLWNFALDGLISFTTLPLRIWSYVGVLIAFTSFLYAFFIIGRVLVLGIDVPGYASLLTVILFIGGIQLLTLGIIGEYLSRLVTESKQRPIYLVDRVIEPGKTQN